MTAKDTTPLMTACYYGHLRTVELLIAGGADVNCSTDNTNTALIVAAAKGQTGCALKLMEAGAQVNKCNIFGWKPLHFAAHGGFADIVIELLKNGARDSLRSILQISIKETRRARRHKRWQLMRGTKRS